MLRLICGKRYVPGALPGAKLRRTFGADLLGMASFYEVMIERNFSSAHQLRGYKGKCENLHGHNYKIEIFAKGDELNNIGSADRFCRSEVGGGRDSQVSRPPQPERTAAVR